MTYPTPPLPPSLWPPQQRATCLLDAGTATHWPQQPQKTGCPQEAPWLAAQALHSPPGDGLTLVRGFRGTKPTLVIATHPEALAGTLGDVGGTRAAAAIERLRREQAALPAGQSCQILLWLDGGGVRLQEGNAALLAAHTLLTALARAQEQMPVLAIITGRRGCYGAWALAAGLCHHRIMVAPSRLGLNGPKVMERMLPPGALDSHDSARVDAMHGASARLRADLVQQVVADEAVALKQAIDAGLQALHTRPPWARPPAPPGLCDPSLWEAPASLAGNRGMRWLEALAAPQSLRLGAEGSVGVGICSLGDERALLLATGPSPQNPTGALGGAQARALMACLRAQRLQQGTQATAVVLLVDHPGQAMSETEEAAGLHQLLAQLRAEGERVVLAGWPVVGLIVGAAVSGGFLCHGLGAQRLLALDHPAVDIRPMAQQGMQRLLERSMARADPAMTQQDALKTDAQAFFRLGGVQALVPVAPQDLLQPADVDRVRAALTTQLQLARRQHRQDPGCFRPASFGLRVWAKEVWEAIAEPGGDSAYTLLT